MNTYRIIPERSTRHYLLGLLVVAGFLSLFLAPIGWWIGEWIGALAGIGLSVLIYVVADGFAVREIRVDREGMVEFRSSLRGQRVPASRIDRVTGYLDEDEGDRSYNVRIANRRRPIGIDHFPELQAFIDKLTLLNPDIVFDGDWPRAGRSDRGTRTKRS